MKIELIKVGNGSDLYPGDFTKEEIKIIQKYAKGSILNLFSGASLIGHTRIDFSHFNATHRMDVFDYLPTKHYFHTIIIDAPYNQKFADKYQKIGMTSPQFIIFADTQRTTLLFNYIDKMDPDIIILKSWNFYCLKRYKMKKCFICYPGGYRKSTFLIIMERKQKTLF